LFYKRGSEDMQENNVEVEMGASIAARNALGAEIVKSIPVLGQLYGIGEAGVNAYREYKRWNEFCEELSQKITLEDFLTFVKSDEGYYFFKDILDRILKERNQEKVTVFLALLKDHIRNPELQNTSNFDAIVRAIENLTSSELVFLYMVIKRDERVCKPWDEELGDRTEEDQFYFSHNKERILLKSDNYGMEISGLATNGVFRIVPVNDMAAGVMSGGPMRTTGKEKYQLSALGQELIKYLERIVQQNGSMQNLLEPPK
jgi:hypothetical protein